MKKPIQPILQPPVLSLYKELHDVKEIARRIDNRPLCELLAQVKDAFQQILVRAHAGDDEALAHYYNATRQAVMSFDNLVKHELKRTRNIAEFCPHLPVLLSSNPQDIKAAKERVRLLNVGAKAILPTRSGQRTDRRNHWTRLAIFAFDACLKNNQQTPQLEAHLKGVKQKQVKRKSWGPVVGETEDE